MPDCDTNPDRVPAPLPEGSEAPPPGVRTMAFLRWVLVALVAIVAAGAWAWYAREATSGAATRATPYRCPMHPAVVQSTPGTCPVCGMDLVDVDRPVAMQQPGTGASAPAPATRSARYWCPMHPEVTSDDPEARCEKCGGMKLVPRDPAPQPGAMVPGLAQVDLSAERRQLIGLQTAMATHRKVGSELRALGFVSANEQRVAIVTARSSGWIAELKAAQSGQRVKRGDVLLTLDSGEVVTMQATYLQNLQWKKNLAAGPNANSPAAQNVDKDALRRLLLAGMARQDIDTLARTGEPLAAIPVRSPISGWIARKSILPGQYVAAGTELYQLADLSSVWVVAELLEQDATRVKVGQRATLTLVADPGAKFTGRVDFVYPAVNPESRTLQARMEFKNPDLKLRPGAYGEVLIETSGNEALAVPAEAVVDTGDLRYVFVALGGGRFEPRVVHTGRRGGGHVEILEGLKAGDEVVTTANFFADAESRLRAGIDAQAGAATVAAPHQAH